MSRVVDPRERAKSHDEGVGYVDFYSQALKASEEFRADYQGRLNVVKASQMPLECCLDMYQQFIPGGKASGKHRHLSEEVFYVIEGKGYDLHWDVRFNCDHEMEFAWEEEPKKFEWGQGDFVYIPPYVIHKHFNADPKNEARIVVINSRILKPMGFDWFDQLENAEGY